MNRLSVRTPQWFLVLCLCWLASLAGLPNMAFAQTQVDLPVFPKYIVLGVVYAPPGSSSSVTYGNSVSVGSSDTVATQSQNVDLTTTTKSFGASFFGFGATTTNTTTNGWTSSTNTSNTISVQTTNGNSVSTAGPISASLGVNHDNDVIYILLNPVMVFSETYNTASQQFTGLAIWEALLANGCDLRNGNGSSSFVQQLYGCDPNQYPYPDIVGIPVWCLKNPYYPGQGCLQWQQYLVRSWDDSYRGPASSAQTTAYPSNPTNPPALTLQDFADILQADPFVQQNGSSMNVCYPANTTNAPGPNFDPNDSLTMQVAPTTTGVQTVYVLSGGSYTGTPTVVFTPVAGDSGSGAAGVANLVQGSVASVTLTAPGSGYGTPPVISFVLPSGVTSTSNATADAYLQRLPAACGQNETSSIGGGGTVGVPAPGSGQTGKYTRFQPYGTVQYPSPGPDGLPSTYVGSFSYENTHQNISASSEAHVTGTSTGLTIGFSNSASLSDLGDDLPGISSASLSASLGTTNSNELTLTNSNSLTTTDSSTNTANYSITGPQLSDNYSGPATYNVYLDNIYGTYAFYSDLDPQVNLGTIDVTSLATPPCPPANASQPPYACQTINPTTAISSGGIFSTLQPVPVIGPAQITASYTPSSPAPGLVYPVTLINHSNYPLTMVYPAVTFSDPGFVLVEGDPNHPDQCSNQYLQPYGKTSYYCTLFVTFQPQWSDAPNPVTLVNQASVQATMVAAGTENASSFQNILVTSQTPVTGVVTSGDTQGALLIANDSSISQYNPVPNVYNFGAAPFDGPTVPEQFTFTNNYSSPLILSSSPVYISDSVDFTFSNNTNTPCSPNVTIAVGSFCTFDVTYNPPIPASTQTQSYPSAVINVTGSVDSSIGQTVTATAGVIGLAPVPAFAVQVDTANNTCVANNNTSCTAYETVTFTNDTNNATFTNVYLSYAPYPIQCSTTGDGNCNVNPGNEQCSSTTLSPGQSCSVTLSVDAGDSNGATNGYVAVTIAGIYNSVDVSASSTLSAETFNNELVGNVFISTVSASSSQTTTAGSVARYALQVSPSGTAYPSVVTFSATGLPAGATASFSPATLAANAGAQNVVMSVQTAANTSKNQLPAPRGHGPAVYLGWFVLPLAGLFGLSRRRKGLYRLLSLVIICCWGALAITGVTGCSSGGGGSSSSVAPVIHTYTITVTATSAGVSQSTNVTLNVQ